MRYVKATGMLSYFKDLPCRLATKIPVRTGKI